MSPRSPRGGNAPGIAVDAQGGAVIDPTANVLSLVEAAVKRLDDLSVEKDRRQSTEIACVKEISNLHSKHAKEVSDMRASHADAMAVAESSRLNAVRSVDVLNGTLAAERAQQAVNVLAATSKTDAENLRTTLATTAASIAQQNSANLGALSERIAALEKSSYEGQGKSKVADPAMADLLAEVKRLSQSGERTTGKSEGLSQGWAILIAGLGLVGLLIGIAGGLYALLRPTMQ